MNARALFTPLLILMTVRHLRMCQLRVKMCRATCNPCNKVTLFPWSRVHRRKQDERFVTGSRAQLGNKISTPGKRRRF
ncbi:hypothetical protein B0J15DRAFT_488906 [Fusarium solani]|uniref:Secreted protein n=1 Tax=Fusarium solani TaxID=169388 RepID=A0A9P9R552_FUSSL|nr:uncharacterized protein B0J15DRAFT_488906 [Fusarium solani]KAH7266543.1 hypothetical protein B0J15DRAFT_488906 [Fusarium solani]